MHIYVQSRLSRRRFATRHFAIFAQVALLGQREGGEVWGRVVRKKFPLENQEGRGPVGRKYQNRNDVSVPDYVYVVLPSRLLKYDKQIGEFQNMNWLKYQRQ